MIRRMTLLVALCAVAFAAGCGNQQAGYQIDDRNHSLSVMREQGYPGSPWDNWFIVARFPDCQRRFPLRKSGDNFKLDVYRVDPGVFILNHGKRWYVTETQACQWQLYPEPPPEPGDLIGTFQTKGDELVWVDKEPAKGGREANGAGGGKAAK